MMYFVLLLPTLLLDPVAQSPDLVAVFKKNGGSNDPVNHPISPPNPAELNQIKIHLNIRFEAQIDFCLVVSVAFLRLACRQHTRKPPMKRAAFSGRRSISRI